MVVGEFHAYQNLHTYFTRFSGNNVLFSLLQTISKSLLRKDPNFGDDYKDDSII